MRRVLAAGAVVLGLTALAAGLVGPAPATRTVRAVDGPLAGQVLHLPVHPGLVPVAEAAYHEWSQGCYSTVWWAGFPEYDGAYYASTVNPNANLAYWIGAQWHRMYELLGYECGGAGGLGRPISNAYETGNSIAHGGTWPVWAKQDFWNDAVGGPKCLVLYYSPAQFDPANQFGGGNVGLPWGAWFNWYDSWCTYVRLDTTYG